MSDAAEAPVWTGDCNLYWRNDSFGHKGMALFAGGLYVGHVMFCPKMYAVGGAERINPKPYRAWVMTDDDGKSLGWYLTERDAKDAIEDAVIAELGR